MLCILDDRATFSSGYGWDEEQRRRQHRALAGMWAADGQRHDGAHFLFGTGS